MSSPVSGKLLVTPHGTGRLAFLCGAQLLLVALCAARMRWFGARWGHRLAVISRVSRRCGGFERGVWVECEGRLHRSPTDEARGEADRRERSAVAFIRRYYRRLSNRQFATAWAIACSSHTTRVRQVLGMESGLSPISGITRARNEQPALWRSGGGRRPFPLATGTRAVGAPCANASAQHGRSRRARFLGRGMRQGAEGRRRNCA